MATRTVRMIGDEILRKVSRPVEEITPRITELIEDMFETMYAEDGVGLAAVQVGVLRRIIVIDISKDKSQKMCLINPEITFAEGEQCTSEGCLSVPEISGKVVRPEHVIVKAKDKDLKDVEIDAHGLLAKCLCHEIDHLDGVVFTDIMIEEDTEDGRDR